MHEYSAKLMHLIGPGYPVVQGNEATPSAFKGVSVSGSSVVEGWREKRPQP